MTAMQFPKYATLSVSMAPAKYTRALMGSSRGATYVYLLEHGKETVWTFGHLDILDTSCLEKPKPQLGGPVFTQATVLRWTL
jgi:hypothetical protein